MEGIIPHELWSITIDYLTLQDLNNVHLVCRLFHTIAMKSKEYKQLWLKLDIPGTVTDFYTKLQNHRSSCKIDYFTHNSDCYPSATTPMSLLTLYMNKKKLSFWGVLGSDTKITMYINTTTVDITLGSLQSYIESAFVNYIDVSNEQRQIDLNSLIYHSCAVNFHNMKHTLTVQATPISEYGLIYSNLIGNVTAYIDKDAMYVYDTNSLLSEFILKFLQ